MPHILIYLCCFQLIYDIFTHALVKEKGYDPSLLEDNFEDLKDFWYEQLLHFTNFVKVTVEPHRLSLYSRGI